MSFPLGFDWCFKQDTSSLCVEWINEREKRMVEVECEAKVPNPLVARRRP